MREWNGRYRDDQRGGLAWVLWQGGVVGDVFNHSGIGNRHGVYRREEGEETVNIKKTQHHKA